MSSLFVKLLSRFSALNLLLGRAVPASLEQKVPCVDPPRGRMPEIPQEVSNPWCLRIGHDGYPNTL